MSCGDRPVRLLSCGIFRDEYKLLPEDLRQAVDPLFLDSMLHMDPGKLDGILDGFLHEHGGNQVLLSFGDCCPHMLEPGAATCVARTEGVNCCEIYLGRERYDQLRKERTFFLMPEWAKRWEHVVRDELGLMDKQLARDFMTQSMRTAVYIDTGVLPVPEGELAAFSDYTGLQVSVETVGPEHFIVAMRAALQQLEYQVSSTQIREAKPEPDTEAEAEASTDADAGGSARG